MPHLKQLFCVLQCSYDFIPSKLVLNIFLVQCFGFACFYFYLIGCRAQMVTTEPELKWRRQVYETEYRIREIKNKIGDEKL